MGVCRVVARHRPLFAFAKGTLSGVGLGSEREAKTVHKGLTAPLRGRGTGSTSVGQARARGLGCLSWVLPWHLPNCRGSFSPIQLRDHEAQRWGMGSDVKSWKQCCPSRKWEACNLSSAQPPPPPPPAPISKFSFTSLLPVSLCCSGGYGKVYKPLHPS